MCIAWLRCFGQDGDLRAMPDEAGVEVDDGDQDDGGDDDDDDEDDEDLPAF